MRRFSIRRAADAAQLRQELAARGLEAVTVEDPDAEGNVFVTVPDGVNGAEVDGLVNRHFPRTLVAAVMAVDFEGATTLAELRARCIQLRNRTVVALKARWE